MKRQAVLLLLSAWVAPLAKPASNAPQVADIRPGVVVERRVEAMGTPFDLTVEASSREAGLEATEQALSAARLVEQRLSTWTQDSELARLNAAEVGVAHALSPSLAAVLGRAFHWRDATEGAFDPLVGALVASWDLRGKGRYPDSAELKLATRASGTGALQLSLPQSITRLDARATFEEGGFGKGQGLDMALAALREAGIQRARLDLGGQIAILSDQNAQTVTIAHPDRRTVATVHWTLSSGSIATSGNSERGLMIGDERIGHVLDPRTGKPAPDFGSVSVWAPRALDADCLSTALYVMGPEGALEFASRTKDVEVLILERVESGLRLRASAGLRDQLNTLDPQLMIEWIPPLEASDRVSEQGTFR